MTTVIVSGALANRCHNGGGAWVRLNWLLGLRRLGCDVYFIEQISPETCLDVTGSVTSFAESINLGYFRRITADYGLSAHAALIYDDGAQLYGMTIDDLLDLAASSELLINLSGHLACKRLLDVFRRKAYVDLDPGYTQAWHASTNCRGGARLEGHNVYFTIGGNVGKSGCCIPTRRLHWHTIRPPVVLDQWPTATSELTAGFTTIATWRGPFGWIELEGKSLGSKSREFRKFLQLPAQCKHRFEIALKIAPSDANDRQALLQQGWHLVEPNEVAAWPGDFRNYIQRSAAEFSVAKSVYVETNSGWFSDRTAAYLASGKPALVQDTGLSRIYDSGEGLISFRTLEEAIAGAEAIALNYKRHSQAARALAEDHFDSDRVLAQFLSIVGVAP